MDGTLNDDTSIYGLQSSFNDDEDDASEDEDEDNTTLEGWCSKSIIKYLKEQMNIDKDTLDDIVVDNNVIGYFVHQVTTNPVVNTYHEVDFLLSTSLIQFELCSQII